MIGPGLPAPKDPVKPEGYASKLKGYMSYALETSLGGYIGPPRPTLSSQKSQPKSYEQSHSHNQPKHENDGDYDEDDAWGDVKKAKEHIGQYQDSVKQSIKPLSEYTKPIEKPLYSCYSKASGTGFTESENQRQSNVTHSHFIQQSHMYDTYGAENNISNQK